MQSSSKPNSLESGESAADEAGKQTGTSLLAADKAGNQTGTILLAADEAGKQHVFAPLGCKVMRSAMRPAVFWCVLCDAMRPAVLRSAVCSAMPSALRSAM